METKLNYGYTTEPVPGSKQDVSNAKSAMSKQAVANQVIMNSMPQQPGGAGAQVPPPQATGFGRTR